MIHFIQNIIWDIDPETAALIHAWEDEVRTVLQEDYTIMDGFSENSFKKGEVRCIEYK